jgi:hypothetical protein
MLEKDVSELPYLENLNIDIRLCGWQNITATGRPFLDGALA